MTTPMPEIDHMVSVDTHDWGPTEPDEMAVLSRFFPYDEETGTFSFRVGSLVPNTVAIALNKAQSYIGTSGRPNVFTRDYASRHGRAFLTAPWCDIYQTYVGRYAPASAIIPAGDRAYTVYHAQDFDNRSRAYAGSKVNVIAKATPGAELFFDWDGTNDLSRVDHVGLVVKNLGDGRVITVEGNTSDTVALRARSYTVIATVCTPAYAPVVPTPKPPPTPKPGTGTLGSWPYKPGVYLQLGVMNSAGVLKVQKRLNVLGYRPKLVEDGDFGQKTKAGVIWFQKRTPGLVVDGIVGPKTWNKL